jgi:diguanylate cyclase (GGDEF)-like protein/PAS domain S-box-containing protein
MKISGLQRRLLESHLTIAFAGMVFVIVLLVSTTFLGRSADKLSASAGPLQSSILNLINGLQSSIAANHGWVYLGDEKFLNDNKSAWGKIRLTLAELSESQKNNSQVIDLESLDYIKTRVKRLDNLQVGISHVPRNLKSSVDIYEREILPIKEEFQSLLFDIRTGQLNAQFSLLIEPLERVEKFFAESVLHLELLVKSRDSIDTAGFSEARESLLFNATTIASVSNRNDERAANSLALLQQNIQKFGDVADKVIVSHQMGFNSPLHQFLFDRAIPLSNDIVSRLHQLEERADYEMLSRRNEMQQITRFSLTASFLALVALVVAATIVSMKNSPRIVVRLNELSKALENFAEDSHAAKLPEQGNDEISDLTRLFNRMAKAVKQKDHIVKRHQDELELRVESRTSELFQSKELAETTLRSIGDALISVDKSGVVTMFNPAAERLLNIRAVHALGVPVTDILILESKEGEQVQAVEQCIEVNEVVCPEETLFLYISAKEKVAIKLSAAPIAARDKSADGAIVILRDVTKEVALQTELSYQANHDLLTGLSNRKHFNCELGARLDSVICDASTHALAFLDLDNFKVVNDSAGHAAGDELLRQLSRLLGDSLRPGDLLARLGGDEFGIIFAHCTMKQAMVVSRRLRNVVKDFQFVWEGQVFRVGISIGLAQIDKSSPPLSDLLSKADDACYEAKKAGRNTVRVARTRSTDKACAVDVGSVNDVIASAIESSRVEVLFSQINPETKSGKRVVYETVLQVRDDKQKVLPSSVFEPAAERYKHTAALDLIVLTSALNVLQLQIKHHPETVAPVVIKITQASLVDTQFVADVEKMLKQAPKATPSLTFKINENVLISNLSQARQVIERWTACGVTIVLDNFGGNLASFEYLQSLPVNFLQIDDSFIKDIESNPVNLTLVKTIIELAHLLERKTIASAVGCGTALYKKLNEIGVDYVIDTKNSALLTQTQLLASIENGYKQAS